MNMKHTAIATAAALAFSAGLADAQGSPQPGGRGTQTGQVTGSPTTPGQSETRERQPSNDAKGNSVNAFMREAAIGGMAEVELGRLATEKASNDQVKQFGQRMVTDHEKANTELKALAQKKGITLPADLDSKHKQTVDKLSKLSGAAFDRAYMDEMRKDHKKDVSEFKQQASSGSDPELKAWASTTLPTLQEHMQMAERTNAAVGTSGKKNSGTESTGTTGGTTDHGGTTGTPSGTGSNPGSGSTPGSGTTSGSGGRR